MNPFSIKKIISTILLLTIFLINVPSHYVFFSTNSVLTDKFIPDVSVPDTGLVAYYPFNNDYKDYSGNNNHGTAKGNMGFAPGKVGQAASFDGQSWVEVADSDSLDLINSFTFSLVVYKEDNGKGGYSVLLCKGDTYTIDNNAPYALFHTYDGLYPAIRLTKKNIYTDMFFTSRAPDFKKWYHLAVTWDGRTSRLYLDGVSKDSKTWEGPLPSSTSKLLIGYDPTGWVEYFRGYMDEVRIYNRTLSQEEIISFYVTDIPGATVPVTVTPSPSTTGAAVTYPSRR